MDGLLFALTLVAALGSGLSAGVFFAFSAFVMKALARLAPAEGVAAMQSINKLAVSRAFMTALFATALACIALAGWAWADLTEPYAPYLLAGSGLYLVGVIVVTIAYHVPRNEALARVQPTSAEAASHWTRYLPRWTAWNHVRVAAATASAGALTVAIHVG